MGEARRAFDSRGGTLLLSCCPLDHANSLSEQRALSNQPWKEYSAEGGRKYWYNTESKQSTWEMPEVYKSALAQAQPPAAPPAR